MKKAISFICICLAAFSVSKAQNTFPSTGSVGIGITTPDNASVLDIRSTNKGILIPRKMRAHRDAMFFPPPGLLIFQTDNTPGF